MPPAPDVITPDEVRKVSHTLLRLARRLDSEISAHEAAQLLSPVLDRHGVLDRLSLVLDAACISAYDHASGNPEHRDLWQCFSRAGEALHDHATALTGTHQILAALHTPPAPSRLPAAPATAQRTSVSRARR
ncbi:MULTISPECIES: hypothetical protein [Streptomyces]|uniref:hypothetical protein n=1 Tax=Streptomyces TaxID=1883 RepID=UPI00345B7404